jgi:hypothetical protein
MDINPYEPPHPATEKPRRSLAGKFCLLDAVALLGAVAPIVFRFAFDLLFVWQDDSQIVVPLVVFLLVMCWWLVSLVINLIGAVRFRIVSIVGCLMNVASFVAIL